MSDIGIDVIRFVFNQMKVDHEWSLWSERGFTWWSSQLAQHIWAEPCFEDDGVVLTRIHCRTDLVQNYGETDRQLDWLQDISRLTSLSCLIREKGRIQLASSLYMHAEVQEWLQAIMSWIIPIQAGEAWQFIMMGAEKDIELDIAQSEHPQSGLRTVPDDILNLISHVVIPDGQNASRWAGEDLLELKNILQHPPTVMITGDETSVTVEYPFLHHTSLLRIWTGQPHPVMGNGCLILFTLPIGKEDTETMNYALRLNELKFQNTSQFHSIGAWSPDQYGLTYVSFLPNALYYRNSIISLIMSMIGRIRWITEQIYEFDMMENFERVLQEKMRTLGVSGNKTDID